MPTVLRGNTITLELVVAPATVSGPIPTVSNVLVDILNPSAVAVVTDAAGVLDASPPDPDTVRYTYDYTPALDAPLGTWTARWTATVNGIASTETEEFEVLVSLPVSGGILTVDDLNQFSETSRLALTVVDLKLEATYGAEVFGKLSTIYTVTGWTTPETTPTLVRSIIAALMVAAIYERTYSEDSAEEGWYPDKLRKWAYGLLESLVGQTLVLADEELSLLLVDGAISFFPNDLSETDGLGNEGRFSMRMSF